MLRLTYADSENHICHKSGFRTRTEADEWIEKNKGIIVPFKLLADDPVYEGRTITVRDYKNYAPWVCGTYKAEYIVGEINLA